MIQTMSNVIRERCKDGRKHKIKTTGLPICWVDKAEVYRAPSLVVREARRFPLIAMGIGFAVGLLLHPIVFYLGKYILNLLF